MKITAFAASTSKQSINRQLVKHVLKSFADADINLLDLNDFDMPVFSVDREKEGFPEEAQNFLDQFRDCDLIIVGMAEHNGNCTAAFKNVLDWSSRISNAVFNHKPMFLTGTSPGGNAAKMSMEYAKTRFPRHSGTVLETFNLPSFNENFNEEKGILDEGLRDELSLKIKTVKETLTA